MGLLSKLKNQFDSVEQVVEVHKNDNQYQVGRIIKKNGGESWSVVSDFHGKQGEGLVTETDSMQEAKQSLLNSLDIYLDSEWDKLIIEQDEINFEQQLRSYIDENWEDVFIVGRTS